MGWNEDWIKAQQLLIASSKDEQWWRTLPRDQRKIIGSLQYKLSLKEVRQKMKEADLQCKSLLETRRIYCGSLGRRPNNID